MSPSCTKPRRLLWAILLPAAAGCAPLDFDRAIAFYAEMNGATDAAARHTSASPYLRFNSALLDDLDEALAETDEKALRRQAAGLLRAAHALGRKSTCNEIDRLPPAAHKELALRAGIKPDAESLKKRFQKSADAALAEDLARIAELPAADLRWRLRSIRWGVEPLPDDRYRLGRQLLFAGLALPARLAIDDQEAKLPDKIRNQRERAFDRAVLWRPKPDGADSPLSQSAPVLVMEWPRRRDYADDYDRIGAVRLAGTRQHIDVSIDVGRPVVYAWTSEAKIHGRRYPQLNYAWWHPERPAMMPDDPVAGHIDGATLRITLDREGVPAILEASLNCGCGHEVFVSKKLEDAAHAAFGEPLSGKRFTVEKALFGKHDLVVVDTFEVPEGARRPTILLAAGYHEVCRVRFGEPAGKSKTELVEEAAYDLEDYDVLDRLPLGEGVASMFGADGLVHFAGRPEGYGLLGTGMLSAGQPRKRGTQRIRWDAFLQDDPHLLEKALRLPEGL